MSKICFLGAGSTVFAKNVLGDCLHVDSLKDAHVTLVDIDGDRLAASEKMMNNINVQLLTIEAALTRKKERIYQAALLDPHTSAELTIDEIVAMCDELIEAHGDSSGRRPYFVSGRFASCG